MNLITISPDMATRWNTFVATWPDFVFMQSYEWGALKEIQGWKTIRLGVEIDGELVAGAQILIKSIPGKMVSIGYIPRGPLLNWGNGPVAQTLLSAIHQTARQHRAISLKIEPPLPLNPENRALLKHYNFVASNFSNQPQCTMLIDLKPDEEMLLQNMNKTTRYNVRYSARKGVTVKEGSSADLDTFYELLLYTAERANFPLRAKSYYFEEWEKFAPLSRLKLFFAIYEDEVIAVRIPGIFGKTAATFHSGSFDTYRNLKPNELLMWESLKWAKAQGCTTYDVWGIPNEISHYFREDKPLPKEQQGGLWGVYRFKQGFGGDLLCYVGAYDYIYSKPLYQLMNTVTNRLGSLDKLAQVGDKVTDKLGQVLRTPAQLITSKRTIDMTHADVNGHMSAKTNHNKYHCMIVQAYYPLAETRVQRQAEALLSHGYQVDVICMKLPDELAYEVVDGVHVYRLPIKRIRQRKFSNQFKEYFSFLAAALVKVSQLYQEKKYQSVQVHNLPDFLVFAALWPKLNGAKVILDIHDVMPEFFASRSGLPLQSWLGKIVFLEEKLACLFADHVITVTELWREDLIGRAISAENSTVVMNVADPRYFNPTVDPHPDYKRDKFHLIYHGTLVYRYGIDLILHALNTLKDEIPDIHLTIHGRGSDMEDLINMVDTLNLQDYVTLSTKLVPVADLPRIVKVGDLGIVPYRRDVFTDGILPTKLMEYMALGIPAVAARTPGITAYFDESMVEFFTPESVEDLTQHIRQLYYNPERLQTLTKNTAKFTERYNWDSEMNKYVNLIEGVSTQPASQTIETGRQLFTIAAIIAILWAIYRFFNRSKRQA